MKAALEELGWTVDLVRNGTLEQMASAVEQLKNRLSVNRDSYGFFFYAGHGVQSNGENYLIPVNAVIQNEDLLQWRAMSVQYMLANLNSARNALNIVVLDACRDNPFGWSRSGSRGLAVVGYQPAGSIIVYATAAGSIAKEKDSTGRNGLFTGHLLNNLKKPGLSIRDVFDQTGADVQRASSGTQVPAIYSQFFGVAYLGNGPTVSSSSQPFSVPSSDEKSGPGPAKSIPPVDRPYFSTGQKISAGFLNLALGLGSFAMGDPGGGALILGGYAVSAGLILTEIYFMEDGIIGTIGLGVAGVTAILGFVQPYLFDNTLVKKNSAAIQPWSGINAGIVPDRRGKPALMLSYTHSF
jgi:hypothetical protein